MDTSRDSSVWRSLAAAFGDGLAFGVAMKLTQAAARQHGAPQSGPAPLAGRLERIEQRIERIERTPIAAPGATPGPGPAGFDQKVIEAVVHALDERLNEHAQQMERRLAEFEARIAVELKALEQRDQSVASGAQARLEELHSQLDAQIVTVRNRMAEDMQHFAESVAKLVDEQVASRLGALLHPVEQRLREEIERVAGRSSGLDASAAAAAIEEKLAPLRAELSAKDRAIAEMRRRLADSDRTVPDLILSIGQMCRQAAERITGPVTPPAEGAPPPSSGGPETPAGVRLEAPVGPPLESSVPGFAQLK